MQQPPYQVNFSEEEILAIETICLFPENRCG